MKLKLKILKIHPLRASIVILVSLIGTYLLLLSHAQTPAISLSAASGSQSGGAQSTSCSNNIDSCVIFNNSVTTTSLNEGVQFHCNWSSFSDSDRTTVLSKMQAAGMKWVRIDVGWASVEPAAGTYSWSLNDKCVQLANQYGMKVLETLWMTPGWAGPSLYGPPNNMNDYGDIAQTIANRYNGSNGFGKVDAWEIWNEPDSSQGNWSPNNVSPQNGANVYVSMVKASYARFHQGSPNTQVVVGGPAGNKTAYINMLYSGGLTGSDFDVISVHPYEAPGSDQPPYAPNGNALDPNPGQYGWPGDGYMTHTPTLHQLMVNHGDGSKPIWWTEYGWSTCTGSSPGLYNSCVSEVTQGSDFVQTTQLVKGNYPWVTNIFWYDARNDSSTLTSWGDNHGLLNYDNSSKSSIPVITNCLLGQTSGC